MHIRLSAKAEMGTWLNEDQFLLALEDGDLRIYTVAPFENYYQEHSLWSEGTDLDPRPTALATFSSGEQWGGVVSYGTWLFPFSSSGLGQEIDFAETITALAIDGVSVIVGDSKGNICVLSADVQHVVRRYPRKHAKHITAMSLAPDGQHIATADSEGTVKYWNVLSGRVTFSKRPSRHYISQVACRDATVFYSDNQAKRSRDARNQFGVVSSARQIDKRTLPGLTTFAWAPTQQVIAAGDRTGQVHVWKPDDSSFTPRLYGEHQTRDREGKVVTSPAIDVVAFSPSGRLLLSCAEDNPAIVTPLALPRPRDE